MPGLRLFKTSYYSHIGANEPILSGTINIGCTKGRGSSTRMLNYCTERSANPSGCINQFININSPPPCPSISLEKIATTTDGGITWTLNEDTTILACQVLTINVGANLIIPINLTLINNGTIIIESSSSISNNGTINNKNGGTIQNNGQIGNGSSTFINESGGTVNTNYAFDV
jgi:hypothetical protein